MLDRIGDKWSLLVLHSLSEGALRFSELVRNMEDISKQMLSKTLKRLEKDGFIRRTLYPEVPLRVEYELTDIGKSFLEPMAGLIIWANANHQDIVLARQQYQLANSNR
ncbi:MAG: winged helix-turn-helix transcriptional regulator [Pseudodesulfovibrio sp.]|uniref:winged helix-turn-helix transcriptional regulator n=1 Tax=Pseudodesulfovibrio sp. TaxID=2035812 RepID=UPI003D133B64